MKSKRKDKKEKTGKRHISETRRRSSGTSLSKRKSQRLNNKKKGTVGSLIRNTVLVEPHPRFPGVFVGKGKADFLLTKNLVPGTSVYGEKRIAVCIDGEKTEYRVWNVYRSKLAAGIVCGIESIHIEPGIKVLYLGAASGTSVSHVSDIVGKDGVVYAVEFSERSGRDLMNMSIKRPNIVPIIEDARYPSKYRMLVPIVDCIFSDVSQPDQTRIVALNAQYFLKWNGGVSISIKASCVNSALPAETVFANEVNILRENNIRPREQVTLEPFEISHALVVCVFKNSSKIDKK